MGHYCVNVYENDFNKMYALGMLGEITEDSKTDCYVLNSLGKYTDDMGLTLDSEYGEAILI